VQGIESNCFYSIGTQSERETKELLKDKERKKGMNAAA